MSDKSAEWKLDNRADWVAVKLFGSKWAEKLPESLRPEMRLPQIRGVDPSLYRTTAIDEIVGAVSRLVFSVYSGPTLSDTMPKAVCIR